MSVVEPLPQPHSVPPDDSGVAAASQVDAPPAPMARPRWRRWLASIPIWMLYVPNLLLVRLLGTRRAIAWARYSAYLHYGCTYLGAQRATLRALRHVVPLLDTPLTARQILRQHLQMKHECFIRLRLMALGLSNNGCDGITWVCSDEVQARMQHYVHHPAGLFIVGFHLGFFRLSAMSIPHIFPGCKVLHASRRVAHYAPEAIRSVAQLAYRNALQVDRHWHTPIYYLRREEMPLRLCKLLRGGAAVAVAADGMLSSEFVEVPFLDGTLRLPCGWVRLAAITGANIVLVADSDGDASHRQVHVDCTLASPHNNPEQIDAVVRQTAHVLEGHIRQQPWAWHPWRRLRWEVDAQGVTRYWLTVPGEGEELSAPEDWYRPSESS